VRHARVVRAVAPVAPAPQPILVSAATEARPSCFWCGRPVFVSGLSF
jgi:hypothetical protein